MTKEQRRRLWRILVAAALFLAGVVFHFWFADSFPHGGGGIRVLFLFVYLFIGYDIVLEAAENIARGEVFDENFLMTVATLGALALGQYDEAVAVMLFYQAGEWFQSYAIRKSRRSIADLMDIRPDFANVLREGRLLTVAPEAVAAGEAVVVRPGERIPLDGVVAEGRSAVDASALTGESVPREAGVGDSVISGCINLSGKLVVTASREYGQSTVAKILELVENSAARKSRSEAFITRFARYYTPVVVGAAAILAAAPPLVGGGEFSVWVLRALTFLVISCPCALVISVPLSFFGGIGGASKAGILVKGGNYLEALAAAEIAVFDKTGTLTKGSFAVTEARPAGAASMTADELLEIAAHAEQYSTHPIANSVKAAYKGALDQSRVSGVEEIPGCGVRAGLDGRVVLAGNARLMERGHIDIDSGAGGGVSAPAGTVVHVAVDGRYAGRLLIEDEVKPDAAQAVAALREAGVKKLFMFTGDADAVGQKVAGALGLDGAYTELLPGDKVAKMEDLLQELRGKSAKGKLLFVGDGINDAPVLARSDVGVAMGGLGSDAAIEAADVVIMTDEPSRLAVAIRIARKTLGIVNQNIVFALAVKFAVLALGALGYASMWAAVFADVGVSFIAILNAVRALDVKGVEARR